MRTYIKRSIQRNCHLKGAVAQALIVLVPSYLVAFLTDKMVYVVPTLAAAGIFATTLELGKRSAANRVDEDADTSMGAEEVVESGNTD